MAMKTLAKLLFLVVALTSSQLLHAQNTSEAILNNWLTAFNSSDPADLKNYYEKMGYPYVKERVMNVRRTSGGFELLKMVTADENSVVGIVTEKNSDMIGELHIDLSDNGTKIKAFSIRGMPRPDEFAIPRLSQQAVIKAVADKAEELNQQDLFSGNILITKNREILLEKSVGYENRDNKVLNSKATKFRLGSMNKMFTAVATLQLVDAGKLKLDATIGEYLPDYPNEATKNQVTIRHLLNHTGGTGDFFGPNWAKDRLELKTHSDYVAKFGQRAPLFEPGSQFRYSNYGFVLLGAIIEAVTKQTYYDYVQNQILNPLDMKDTGFYPESSEVGHRSKGYMWKDEGWVGNEDTLPWRGMAAGGGYSTTGDLLKFAYALLDNKLISEATFKQALTPAKQGYGFGFGIRGEGELLFFGHNGGAPGMSTDFRIYPNSGYIVICLSNYDPPAGGMLPMYFENRMPIGE